MKIQEIKFPLNIGVADTLTFQVRKDLEAEDYTIVYYAFLDSTQKTKLQDEKEIPNKMLHASNIKISGDDYLKYKENNDLIYSIIASILGVTILEN